MIWIFGDSFSCTLDNPNTWATDYVKWKGYIPKTFGQIIGDHYGIGVKTMAESGLDNDTIYEIICESAPHINSDDIILIGWSNILRFRLSINNKWQSILWYDLDSNFGVDRRTILDIITNRESKVYEDEFLKRKNFLNWLFKNNKIIHWTPFSQQFHLMNGFEPIETVYKETNGLIDDKHYSEFGHKVLADRIITILDDI